MIAARALVETSTSVMEKSLGRALLIDALHGMGLVVAVAGLDSERLETICDQAFVRQRRIRNGPM